MSLPCWHFPPVRFVRRSTTTPPHQTGTKHRQDKDLHGLATESGEKFGLWGMGLGSSGELERLLRRRPRRRCARRLGGQVHGREDLADCVVLRVDPRNRRPGLPGLRGWPSEARLAHHRHAQRRCDSRVVVFLRSRDGDTILRILSSVIMRRDLADHYRRFRASRGVER